jgi:hypothetical protein
MRTETIAIFMFDELSDEAKQTAIERYQVHDLWDSSEWWESANAFSELSLIEINSVDYNAGQVDIRWTAEQCLAELTGLRAWKWLQNNGWFKWGSDNKSGLCTMTGFCGDCAFGDPLAEYEKNPLSVPDLEQVFYEMAQSWVFDARSDCEASYSDECITENIQVNEYEFYANGEMV